MSKLTHASVFSGIGGSEVAASMLGWENLFHCEINPFGKAVLDYWYPNAKSYGDITKTDFREWRGRVNVLTGGFPCQPFSYAGKRRGEKDDRYLWPHLFRCIDEIRPDWVVCENVNGILTMVEQGEVFEMASQRSLFDEDNVVRGYRLVETFTIERICNDLESHGYSVQSVLIPACAVGAPHRRDRVFVVGHRTNDAAHSDCTRAGNNDRSARNEERRACQNWREGIRQGDGEACASRVKPTSNDATDPNDTRQSASKQSSERERSEIHSKEREQSQYGSCRPCIPFDSADSEGKRGKRTRLEQPKDSGAKQKQLGRGGIKDDNRQRDPVSQNALHDGCERRYAKKQKHKWDIGDVGARNIQWLRDTSPWFASARDSKFCGERWRNFPTVSPVHRGNDGFPFDVDDLTIPFSKWRTESLKAYGNAIVPQVMYEIFLTIQEVESTLSVRNN